MTTSSGPALPDEKVAACPDCDAAHIVVNSTGPKGGPRYLCRDCGATFETFETRDRRSTQDTRFGLAKRLDDASPEEVGR